MLPPLLLLEGRTEGNALFNDTLNTFLIRLYGIGYMKKNHSYSKETRCCHFMGYSFQLAARDLLYAPPRRKVDPLSFFSFQPMLHIWCNKDCGMCYPVCGMVHIKDAMLLIGKSRP